MAQQNVCEFFKFGFCKFKSMCRKQHISEKFSKNECDTKSCSLRHPRICRYYRDIGFCKFGEWCLFKHEGVSKGLKEVKEISERMKNVEKQIVEKSLLIEALDKTVKESLESNKSENLEQFAKDMQNKVERFENNLFTMKNVWRKKILIFQFWKIRSRKWIPSLK